MSFFRRVVFSFLRQRRHRSRLVALSIIALCALSFARADEVANTFFEDKLKEIDATISLAISDGHCPGGV
ncbi:MAG TPA: hypothetical protein VFV83_01265, partial [Chthoniobacteraceae bacterium]|nr:hypothetical protein [Chthoniobacteraceae bacterium]